MQHESYLAQREVARILKLAIRTLERHRRNGTGPRFIRAGRRILYRPCEIEAWLAARTFVSTAEADAAREAADEGGSHARDKR
jgi:predicted DNA-binding transcriptional regulator AlpA